MASIISLLLSALLASDAWNLQPFLDEIRDGQDVPGISVVVTQRNDIKFAGASGQADLETGRRMTPDTVLYAGSLSKILTAVLTLQLVEAELRSAPGESVRYSNIGYAALGPIIARAAGENYGIALRERVLVPLQMTSSGAGKPGDGLSAGYSPPNQTLPNARRPFAGLGRAVGERRIREYHDANAMTPAFGLFASANDLGRLARMLLGFGDRSILSDDMRLAMMTTRSGARGLGIRLDRVSGRPVARHGGWFAAHRTHLLLDLHSNIAVVVMANGDNASPDVIAEQILATALAHFDRDSD